MRNLNLPDSFSEIDGQTDWEAVWTLSCARTAIEHARNMQIVKAKMQLSLFRLFCCDFTVNLPDFKDNIA